MVAMNFLFWVLYEEVRPTGFLMVELSLPLARDQILLLICQVLGGVGDILLVRLHDHWWTCRGFDVMHCRVPCFFSDSA